MEAEREPTLLLNAALSHGAGGGFWRTLLADANSENWIAMSGNTTTLSRRRSAMNERRIKSIEVAGSTFLKFLACKDSCGEVGDLVLQYDDRLSVLCFCWSSCLRKLSKEL